MGIVPTRKELSDFFDYHPLLSIIFFASGAFSVFEIIGSVTAPKGQGPFSGMGSAYSPNYMTRSTLSSMEQDVKSLRNRIDTKAKVPDWAESKIYTAADRINTVDDYMTHRASLGHITSGQRGKLTKIEGELRKASQMHASQADRISQLGASTSTTSSTSTSHAMMHRPRTEEIMPPRQVSYSDMFGIPTQALANLGSVNLPPGMRRRVVQRRRGTGSLGNAGVQSIDTQDNIQRSNYNSVSDLFGVGGVVPQPGQGWTE
jgi:hypothetical protein